MLFFAVLLACLSGLLAYEDETKWRQDGGLTLKVTHYLQLVYSFVFVLLISKEKTKRQLVYYRRLWLLLFKPIAGVRVLQIVSYRSC